jgi:hypothetical protein
MKILIARAVSAGVSSTLAQCNADRAAIEAAVAQNLPAICAGGASLDAAFQTAAVAGAFSKAQRLDETAAAAALAAVCANPPSDPARAVQAAAQAYAAVARTMAAAKAAR